MGDYFQTVVDTEVSLEDAGLLADEIKGWLIAEEIVAAVKTDCVLGGDGMGYAPGRRYDLAAERDSWLRGGLAIVVARTAFHPGQGGNDMICRECGECTPIDHSLADEILGEVFMDAIDAWEESRGPALLVCPACGHAEPVTDWKLDPPWGFGNLGFEFWNWPRLRPSFIAELSQRLGHRTVVISGKL